MNGRVRTTLAVAGLALAACAPVSQTRAETPAGQMTWTLHFTVSTGVYAYGGYPDIDGLFREQAGELDRKKREATLHRVQQLVHEKVMYLPIWQLVLLQGHGPRVVESGLGLIADYPWSGPYEDVRLT